MKTVTHYNTLHHDEVSEQLMQYINNDECFSSYVTSTNGWLPGRPLECTDVSMKDYDVESVSSVSTTLGLKLVGV